MSRARSIFVALAVLYAPGALAADENSKFALKGAGFLPCQVFSAERERKSNTYYLIAGWVEGYISAHNRNVPDTFDITSFESTELLLSVMQSHCKANPNDRLYPVLNSMLAQLHPDRLQKESPRVEITEGKRKAVLYEETIRRIQGELTRRGLYKGPLDGRYTEATNAALKAFQSDVKFQTTGFPDQATLWRLMRK
jgi:hypothetical protein